MQIEEQSQKTAETVRSREIRKKKKTDRRKLKIQEMRKYLNAGNEYQ